MLRKFISVDELSDDELQAVVRTACAAFNAPEVTVPVLPLRTDSAPAIYIAELWHGPTLAFKDLGLQILGALLDVFLARRKRRLTVLVGTSGDTGVCRGPVESLH